MIKNRLFSLLFAVLTLFFLTILSFSAPAQSFDWARHASGPGSEGAFGVATDLFGNSFLTGFYTGPLDLGDTVLISEGRRDLFLAKYNDLGDLLWARSIGGSGDDFGFSCATDNAGNIYVSGTFEDTVQVGNTTLISAGGEDLLLVKYNGSGSFQWAQRGGGDGADRALGVAVAGGGKVWITGFISQTATVGDSTFATSGNFGDTDIFIANYSEQGQFLWANQLGGPEADLGKDVAVDGSGNAYLTGSFRGTVQFGLNNYTAVGSDGFAVKYTPAGSYLGERIWGGSGNADGRKITADSAGNMYVAVNFNDGIFVEGNSFQTTGAANEFDFLVVKYDDQGDLAWAKQCGSPTLDNGNGIGVDAAGNVFVSGNFQTNFQVGDSTFFTTGFEGLVLAAYDEDGDFLYAVKDTSNPGMDFVSSEDLAVGPNGSISLAGIFGGSAYVGDSLFLGPSNEGFIVVYDHMTVSRPELLTEGEIKVFPNPFQDRIDIDLKKVEGITTLQLTDLSGKVITKKENLTSGIVSLETRDLISGMYLLSLNTRSGRQVFKLIKR